MIRRRIYSQRIAPLCADQFALNVSSGVHNFASHTYNQCAWFIECELLSSTRPLAIHHGWLVIGIFLMRLNYVSRCVLVSISWYTDTHHIQTCKPTHTHIRATMNEKINRLSSGLWSSNGLLIFIKSAKWNSNDKIALCSTKRKYAIRLKSIRNCDWNLNHAALCAVHKRFFFHLFFPSDLS